MKLLGRTFHILTHFVGEEVALRKRYGSIVFVLYAPFVLPIRIMRECLASVPIRRPTNAWNGIGSIVVHYQTLAITSIVTPLRRPLDWNVLNLPINRYIVEQEVSGVVMPERSVFGGTCIIENRAGGGVGSEGGSEVFYDLMATMVSDTAFSISYSLTLSCVFLREFVQIAWRAMSSVVIPT